MKNVPRLPTEPAELTAYRSATPADAAAAGPDAGQVWERFRGDAAYQFVRDRLVAAQQGLCGYCEQRLTFANGTLHQHDQQIEHVLAKSGGAGRTLDVTNFMLCCSGGSHREKDKKYHDEIRHYQGETNISCGSCKGDRDLGERCDPRTFPCAPSLVNVGLDGALVADDAACKAAGVNPTDLNKTINDVLNLNCERLRVPREKRVRAILHEVVWLADELDERLTLSTVQKQALRELLVEGRLAPDEHGHLRAFWSVDRKYLGPWSEIWIAKNAHRLGCRQTPKPTAPLPMGGPRRDSDHQ